MPYHAGKRPDLSPMATAHRSFTFGPFVLDAARRTLAQGGEFLPLGPKAVDLLLCLVERSGQLVTKDEMLTQVWPDTFVEEANLSVQVSALRKVLGEQADGRPFIETVPRRGYRFLAPVRAEEGVSAPRSLAVLPFQPLTPASDEEHIGVGLADALITRLSNVGQILVRPTSAVTRYAGRGRDAGRAARELGVDVVLDGRWQREGEQIRVTAQLVDALDGATRWATVIEEPWTRLFRVQDSLASQLADALALHIGVREQAQLHERATEDNEAYQSYLRGRYFWNRLTPPWLTKAREAFARAAALDPTYARAHAGLAETDIVLALYGETPPREALERARAAAGRALELDEGLAEAHTALGFVHAFADWSPADAERHLRRAVALHPRSAAARQWCALYLALTGRLLEAMGEILIAQELDPLSLTVHTNLGFQHFLGGQADEELEAHQRSLELEPGYALGHWALGLAYTLKGAWPEAIAAQERAIELSGGSALMKSLLARLCALAGDGTRARALLVEVLPQAEVGLLSAYQVAMIHAALGEMEPAFAWLERGYAARDLWLVLLGIDPMAASLREDPRCSGLLLRIGFVTP